LKKLFTIMETQAKNEGISEKKEFRTDANLGKDFAF
jgi:hypothetical protein